MKKKLQVTVHLLLTFLLTCAVGFAQLITTATINGEVTDSSGAKVPGASITLTNRETGTETKTQSNSDGSFAVPGLSIGSYSVVITKQGFQSYSVHGIILHPTIVATVNAALSAGQVQTQVQVEASAVQIETSTAELSNQVSEQQVSTLPVNGRNYQSLSALIPGVVNVSPGQSLNQGGFITSNVMSVNGMGISGTMYYVDGIWNMNTGNMTQTTITPNPDTIGELRVLQSNYGAQYSLNGANVVLLQTKSGTRAFHGTGYEYFRNDDLNARNFFSPTVPTLRQNIFGYTVGGPVFIPKHYNRDRQKTFFFWSEQWVRQHTGTVLTGATPSAAMRSGLFSGTLTDPSTGQPFPQTAPGVTQIPTSRISQPALAAMNALLPLPNNPAGGFLDYINLTPQINSQRDDEIKIDHIFNDKLRLMGEYFDSHSNNLYSNESVLNSPFATVRSTRTTPNSLAQLQLIQVWSPAIVNTTAIAMNRYLARLSATGVTQVSQIPGFNEVLPFAGGSAAGLIPEFTFGQSWSLVGLSQNVPQPGASDLEDTFSDDWSLLRGNHYIQAGFQLVFGTKRQTAFAQANGLWSFSGAATGSAMADFLLGDPATFSQGSNRPRYYLHYTIASPYLQDRWKITKRLTVTAGLRLEYMPSAHAQPTFESVFDPADYNPAQAPGVTTKGVLTPTANSNPLNGLIINSANGVPLNFSNKFKYYWAPSAGFALDIRGDGKTSLRGGYGITYYSNFNSTCAQSCVTNPPFVQSLTLVTPTFPNPVGAVSPAGAPTIVSEDLGNLRDPMVQSYSLSLEHQFQGNWLVSVAGAGNIARHLPQTSNINQPLPDAPYNFNPIINSGSTFTYLYGPYLGYGAINTATFNANAYWDALEISMRHPVGHDILLSASYTWQHDLTQGRGTSIFSASGVQDSYNPRNDYGNSNLNVPQVFTFNAIWSLPWFRTADRWKRALLGGWQYSDITIVQSGFSLDPALSTATKGIASRPNRTTQSINGPGTVQEWFNTGAFSAPAAGFFGNAAPGSITGPGTTNFDMALYKDFRLTERITVQFRAELFNVFNHPNFSTVQTSFGAANFGQVTAARDPRIAEGVLRISF